MKPAQNLWFAFRLLSDAPLITYSNSSVGTINVARLVELAPEVFDRQAGLHLISITWNLEDGRADKVAKALDRAHQQLPNHTFVVLANTGFESMLLSRIGVPNIQINNAMFQDDKDWHIADEPVEGLGRYAALYNACLSPFKRHNLCADIDRLMLIYGINPKSDDDAADLERVKSLLPDALFANHHMNGGTYSFMSPQKLRLLHGHADVALCLSAEEGYMRASMQALLTGLPVVSTPSIGGRDRYYDPDYTIVVDPTKEAVAHGVAQLRKRGLSRNDVRDAVLANLAFDRRNALAAINRLARNVFGGDAPELDFEAFRGGVNRVRAATEIAVEVSNARGGSSVAA